MNVYLSSTIFQQILNGLTLLFVGKNIK